jgi:hypothetical protein
MGAGLQNGETAVSATFIRSVPVYRRYRYLLNNNQKEEKDVEKQGLS